MTVASIVSVMDTVSIVEEPANAPRPKHRAFEACCDGLYRFILVRVGGDRHTAEDVLQQTCCIAAGRSSMPRESDQIEAWLRGVARNLIRRRWRDLKRMGRHIPIEDAPKARQLAEDMESRPLPADVLMQKESTTQLMLALTSLPGADQRVLFAFYFEGRSHAEIADELGVSSKSVEAKLYRVRNRLRVILKDIGKDR